MKQNLILKYFTEICQIPHTSGHEEKIREYIINILKKENIKHEVDEVGNVYISKQGKTKPILFQAHMDMVGTKTEASKHNFLTDPIDYYEDNGWIKAKGTTLGADNGIGVAMILALLTDNELNKDYSIEALLTVDEEVGCVGAASIKPGFFKAKYLINLDSEEDYAITIGSASSERVVAKFPIKRVSSQGKKYLYKMFDGNGGHSGAQIHETRANCILESIFFFASLMEKFDLEIISINGGMAFNAIPTNCEIIFQTNSNIDDINKAMEPMFENFKKAFIEFEDKIKYSISLLEEFNENPIGLEESKKLINFLNSITNGMHYYSHQLNLTAASTNVGIVKTELDNIEVTWMNRSSFKHFDQKQLQKIKSLTSLASAKIVSQKYSPGLAPMLNNPLAKKIQEIALSKFNHKMDISSIHAGLEFSYITEKYPDMIPVSIGPTMYEVHTPNEKVEIKSVFFMYDLVKELLNSELTK